MKVLVIAPAKKPEVREIDDSLTEMQKIVEGFIETMYPWNDRACIVVNEEGKINGLPFNRAMYDNDGQIYDIIAGTFFIVGLGDYDFTGLTDEQIALYSEMFETPQAFHCENGFIHVEDIEDD